MMFSLLNKNLGNTTLLPNVSFSVFLLANLLLNVLEGIPYLRDISLIPRMPLEISSIAAINASCVHSARGRTPTFLIYLRGISEKKKWKHDMQTST